MKHSPRLTIVDHKGFSMSFENRWRVSVQFGPGNYVDAPVRGAPFDAPKEPVGGLWSSPDAEIAVIRPDGEFLRIGGDDVVGWARPDVVAELLARVARPNEVEDLEEVSDNLHRLLTETETAIDKLADIAEREP